MIGSSPSSIGSFVRRRFRPSESRRRRVAWTATLLFGLAIVSCSGTSESPPAAAPQGDTERAANNTAAVQGPTSRSEAAPTSDVAVKSDSAANQPAPDLHYGWKTGRPYVYAVHIKFEVGKATVTLDGSSIYKVKSSDEDGATLTHQGWLISRLHSTERGAAQRSQVRMPPGPVTTELEADPKGDTQMAKASMPLPLLGDLATLVIEPLPDEPLGRWEEVKKIALNEVHTSGGDAAPFRFGRPSLLERRRESRTGARPGIGGRAGAGARPGNRLAQRAGRRGRMPASPAPAPVPAPRQVEVISHPAQERTTYTIGTTSGDSVSIAKTYELRSEEKVNDEPALLMTGQGTIAFDPNAGVPRAMEYTAKITQTAPNVTMSVPVTVSYRLLEGTEAVRAMRFPAFPPTAMNPLSDAELNHTLLELKSANNRLRQPAAARLRDAAPIEARRAEVNSALAALLDQPDGSVHNPAILALAVWGDETFLPLLVDHLNNERYGSTQELLESIGRLGPDERTTRALVAWLRKDRDRAARALRAAGADAEPALLEFVGGTADAESRAEACRILKDIGTSRSIPVLEKLAAQRDKEELGRAAEGVIRNITGRQLKDADLKPMIEALDSPDLGRRRDVARRFLAIRPFEARRAQVVTALIQHLDEPDNETQGNLIRALADWGRGSADAVKALTAQLKEPRLVPWRETIEALGKMSPDRAAIAASAGRIDQDRGHILRALQAIGPPAEPALIAIGLSHRDPSIRSDACRTLENIVTPSSIPALRDAAKKATDPTKRSFEDLVKRLEERRLDDGTITAVIEDLKSTDNGKRYNAATRLAEAQPDDRRRSDVVKALSAAVGQGDEGFQRQVMRALGAWGDRGIIPILISRARDRSYRRWNDALEALVRLEPNRRSAEVVVERMADDYGLANKLLKKIGAPAEPAAAEAFQHARDLRTRIEASRVLDDIGTEASLPMLQQYATQTQDGALAREAGEALKVIRERG